MAVLLYWVGGAELVALVTLAVTALVQWRGAMRMQPYDALVTSLRETQLQLADLADHVERKETRDRVRKMRDSREDKQLPLDQPLPQPGTPEFKAALRRKAMAARLNGHG